MAQKNYKTEGREALISFLSKNPDRLFTTEELCVAVHGDAARGKSSVYRHLSELCAKESVRKFRSDEKNCSVYQYVGNACNCGTHFHEKCTSCGRLSNLDCDDSLKFAAHLLAEHGFEIDCGQSILYGLCADCRAARGGV